MSRDASIATVQVHPLDRLAARALQGDGLTYGERADIARILTAEARRLECNEEQQAMAESATLANVATIQSASESRPDVARMERLIDWLDNYHPDLLEKFNSSEASRG